MKKQEPPRAEGQASPDPADGLQKRRNAIIKYFRHYLRLTFEELRVASAQEAEALRAPLLAMRLDEEEIRGWERFRDEFAPRAIHAAEALVAAYESLLDQAENDHLLERECVTQWRRFFRSNAVDFKEKREAVAELRAALSVERAVAEERQRVLEALDKSAPAADARRMEDGAQGGREERERAETEHGGYKSDNINKEEKRPPAEEENTGRNPSKQIWATLRALPGSLIPLYATAVGRGADAVRALMQVMERRMHHEERPAAQPGRGEDRRFVLLWRDESMEAPERALEHVQSMAQLGDAQPVIVPQGVSRGAQAAIVRHIHPVLRADVAACRR